MATFAPEFAQYWRDSHAGETGVANPDANDRDTPSDEAALVELAERVSAARSVV
jgi:hypothetical protein